MLPGVGGGGAGGRAALPRARRPVRRARRGHRALGRRAAGRRRGRHLARAAEPHPRGRPRARRASSSSRASTNLDDHAARSRRDGFYYAPDPSSQQVCTIGGNVAENSGGAHCLKYGFTVNHVLAAEVVLPDGELVDARRAATTGPTCSASSSAPRGRSGSRRRLTRAHPARARGGAHAARRRSSTTDDAGDAVSGVIAAGILPAAIEMMDALTIEAVEARGRARATRTARRGADRRARRAGGAGRGRLARGRGDLPRARRAARCASRRDRRGARAVWRGRKAAFAAMGRIAPSYYVQDGVVPRTQLPEVLRRIDELVARARPARRQRLPRRRRQPAPARPLRRPRRRARPERAEELATADPRGLHRRRRLAHRRARRRRRQGVLDAAAVRRGRPRGDAAPARARSTRPGSRTRARSSRRRASAARCRARTARTRSSGPALPSVSEPIARARAGRPDVHRRGGMRLSELREHLAAHGQMLALDPPGDPTIGACLAGDLSGPRRHRYGAMRDLVIGVTVVLADGSVASSGGKVVKNVAGYDLGKLFSGSRGAARLDRAARAAAAPAAGGAATVVDDDRADWQRAAPLAARAERGRPRRRAACTCCSRARAAVDAQVARAPGGERGGRPWDESCAALQARAAGPRAARRGRTALLARPGPRRRVRPRGARAARGRRSPSACARRGGCSLMDPS